MKNLQKHVTCSICLDTYTNPKTIACLHTFCCHCLEKHARTSARNEKFRCPECQAEMTLPDENRFDKLPTSFHHNSLLSVLGVRQVGDGSEISCGICKKTSVEISYCFDCEKLMCSDCKNAHELFKNAAFKGHKVTPVKQFQDKDYEAMLKRQSFCSQQYHEREPTRFYCTECKMCVCQICINTTHKPHGVEPIEKAADNAKGEILTLAEMMEERITTCDASIRQIEEMEAEMEANIASSKREVSRATDQIVTKARELERDNITALENRRLLSVQKFNSAKQQLQSFAKQFTQAVDFAQKIVEINSCSDVIQSHKQIASRFKDLQKIPVPPLPARSSAMFVQTCNPSNLELGFTATANVDVNKSVVNGLNQEFQAGVEGTLVVRPRIHPKEGVTEAVKTKIYVQVLMEPVEKVSSMDVFDQGDGSYQVKFVAKVPGCLKVSVKINNKELAKSPFTVHVKERRIKVVGKLEFLGKVPKCPLGVAVNSEGLIAVSDSEGHCILLYNAKGEYQRELGSYGENEGQFNHPVNIIFINDDEVLVADAQNHRLQQFNVKTGNFVKSFGKQGTGAGEFDIPCSVCLNDSGNIVVTEGGNERVQVLTEDGEHLLTFGENGELDEPVQCIYWRDAYIVSSCESRILNIFDCGGTLLHQIGESGTENRHLPSHLWRFCIESSRNHQNLLVNDINDSCNVLYQFTMDNFFTGKTVDGLEQFIAITAAPDGRILAIGEKTVLFLK